LYIPEKHRVGSGAYGEIGGHAMQTTEDLSATVPSKLANLRDVPLADLPALSMVTLDEALGRLIPDPQAAAAPVAAFQSAI
jgi:FXSXX-COOH protein